MVPAYRIAVAAIDRDALIQRLKSALLTNPGGFPARTSLNKRDEMNIEPEETAAENSEKQIKIERGPEPMFGDTRERLSEVTDDKPAPQNRVVGPGKAEIGG